MDIDLFIWYSVFVPLLRFTYIKNSLFFVMLHNTDISGSTGDQCVPALSGSILPSFIQTHLQEAYQGRYALFASITLIGSVTSHSLK